MKDFNDIEAENSVLGGIIYERQGIFEVIKTLEPNDFYSAVNKTLYQACVDLFNSGQEISNRSVVARLEDKKLLADQPIMTILAKLSNYLTTTTATRQSALRVKAKSLRRRLLECQVQNEADIKNQEKVIDQVIADIQDRMMSVGTGKTTDDSIQKILKDLEARQDEYSKKYEDGKDLLGLSCGIPQIDSVIDGLRPGHFWVIGGWKGYGKTNLGLNILHNVMEQSVPTSIVTLEMSQVDLTSRLMGIHTGMTAMKILKGIHDGEQQQAVVEAKEFLKNTQTQIHCEYDLTKIKNQIRYDVHVQKTQVVMIDYLQKMTIDFTPVQVDHALTSRAVIELANLAQELKITIVLLSQVSNEAERTVTPGAGFKGSGTIEDVADLAIRLHRDKPKEDPTHTQVPLKIRITKNKYGFDGAFDYFLDLPSGRVLDPAFVPQKIATPGDWYNK